MLRYIIIIYLLSFHYRVAAQNLIPNPSLEEKNICQKYHEACAPKAWRSHSLKAFLYHDYQLSTRDEQVVRPSDGYQCIVLRLFNTHRQQDRSFAQTPLLCQLEKGKKYKLTFDFLSQVYVVNNFEVLFVDTIMMSWTDDMIFKQQPQISFSFDRSFSPNEWHTLEYTYEATGTEVGIMIGNFKKDEATKITAPKKKRKRKQFPRRVYHYFDNFSLTPIDTLEQECDLTKNQQYIFKDSARHIIHRPPHSVQNIPAVAFVEMDTLLEEPPIVTSPVPIREDSISESTTFTLPNILFQTNSDQLLPISFRSLDRLINYLEKNPSNNIIITGHTDNIGSSLANQILSEKRAKAVAQYLMIHGITTSRIQSFGKGETMPLTTNETQEGRQLNRRVEFKILQL